jgi:2-oxoisovalerate dehydrogenase E1 component
MLIQESNLKENFSFQEFRQEILHDYLLANQSRQLSLLGRKEVLTGKAKFGIFGDGKEVAQIAYARSFRPGDWRSGYYRDQTFMLAAGLLTLEEFFAQLYGDTDLDHNPGNGGRNFNNHFSTRSMDDSGNRKALTKQKNSSSDISPTAGQMPRLLGLAWASRLFRNNHELQQYKDLSDNGNEVAFGSIGDASTSEGHFFEVLNAAGVLQVPMAIAIWDDGYGISVPRELQTVKDNISEALKGFEKGPQTNGILLLRAKGWDYPELCDVFEKGIAVCRTEHVPVLFHIEELTQPQGHSTSGSHERYKSAERLRWEEEFDCLKKMKEWIIEAGIANADHLDEIEKQAFEDVKLARDAAWKNFQKPIKTARKSLLQIIDNKTCVCKNENLDKISLYTGNLKNLENPLRKDNIITAKKILRYVCLDCQHREELKNQLEDWLDKEYIRHFEHYSANLYVETSSSALNIDGIKPVYSEDSPVVPGREIIRDNFDFLFQKYPLLVAFGEDIGKIGGVNQTYEGLQEKYGKLRISDTGIRETSIVGKGIGLALRGLRPIAEIQYFDYLLFALQTISDDLATTNWRTAGGQTVPLIISTRGHRLEGVWHSGSPLSMVINSIRGVYVCVPRNMTQAAGFYNTLLEGQDPALVIEPLGAYRLKERRPDNIGEYRIPLGVPEI